MSEEELTTIEAARVVAEAIGGMTLDKAIAVEALRALAGAATTRTDAISAASRIDDVVVLARDAMAAGVESFMPAGEREARVRTVALALMGCAREEARSIARAAEDLAMSGKTPSKIEAAEAMRRAAFGIEALAPSKAH